MLRRGSLNRGLLAPGGRRGFTRPASGVQLLLDAYPGAVAAYALTKLRAAYSGSAIRVRRSSDNAEQDIGFVGNALDTASLLSFCGAGDGFVVTWYSQIGTSVDMTQSVTTDQMKIVDSGSIVDVDGFAALQASATNHRMTVPGVHDSTDEAMIFAVVKADVDGSSRRIYSGPFTARWGLNQLRDGWDGSKAVWITANTMGTLANTQALQLVTTESVANSPTTGNTVSLYVDGDFSASGTNRDAPIAFVTGGAIGAAPGFSALAAKHLAWIAYPSNTNRAAIDAALKTLYGIS